MKHALFRFSILALAVLCAGPLRGADLPTPAGSPSPEDQVARLKAGYEADHDKFTTAYGAAKTDEDRHKLISDLLPTVQAYTPRFLDVARRFPHTPAALQALVWVVENGHTSSEGTFDDALKALDADFLDSDQLGPVCGRLVYLGSNFAGTLLRDLVAKSPHRAVRGTACLSLGRLLKRDGGGDPVQIGKIFERAASEFGDVPYGSRTVGQAAEGELFELRHLAVGQPAPEIEGTDAEGKPLKLSDYRGKVVVVDFWGYW